MQETITLRHSHVATLHRAFGDRISIVGDRVLIDLTCGDVGTIDVTDRLAAIGDAADVIDVLRCTPFGDDGIEWIDQEARLVEDQLGIERGALGKYAAEC